MVERGALTLDRHRDPGYRGKVAEQGTKRLRRIEVWTANRSLPSLRHRVGAAVPVLEGRGWQVHVHELPRRPWLGRVLSRRAALRQSRLLVLAKVKLSPPELHVLRRTGVPVVFELDDAIHLRRPRRPDLEPQRSWLRTAKFAATCRLARVVVVGNEVLAGTARRWARRVEVVPTPVELDRYPERAPADRRPRTLVWIGLPENLDQLETLRPVVGRLAREVPDLALRVVCSRFPDWPEVRVEGVPWTAEGEPEALASAGVGLMPLVDNEWTRGKCAFKLLQYMASGLPCVASPVGANAGVVEEGGSGLLASTPEQWEGALRRLLGDPQLCLRMGRAGRERVRRDFDLRVVIPRLADLLEEAAG